MAKRSTKKAGGRRRAAPRGGERTAADVANALAEIAESQSRGVSGVYDAAFSAAIVAAQEKQAKDSFQLYSAHDVLARVICIPVPALAPRFLLQLEGWPLGRFTLIDGFKESCKSAFLNEVGKWHRQQNGLYGIIETEEKDGTTLRDSFFNYDRDAWKYARAHSQEKWNQAFFWFLKNLQRIMDGYEDTVVDDRGRSKKVKVPGAGRVAPACVAVDSISAVLIERLRDEILKEGAPELSHPLGARLLSDFFKVGPKELSDYPISFLAVSHLREVAVSPRLQHIKHKVTTGGEAPKYQMSSEIEMTRRSANQYTRSHPVYGDIHSIDLAMHMRKNSLAPKEWVNVEMVWFFDPHDIDPITKQRRQKTYFDWHSSSIELLLDCMQASKGENEFSARRAKELRDLIDLSQDGDRRMVSSSVLGIPDRAPISYYDAGVLLEHKIQTEPGFCLALYNIMGIRRQFMFQPGIDYMEQIKQNAKRLRDEEANSVMPQTVPVPLPADPGDSGEEASRDDAEIIVEVAAEQDVVDPSTDPFAVVTSGGKDNEQPVR